jgi:hypothetical protein
MLRQASPRFHRPGCLKRRMLPQTKSPSAATSHTRSIRSSIRERIAQSSPQPGCMPPGYSTRSFLDTANPLSVRPGCVNLDTCSGRHGRTCSPQPGPERPPLYKTCASHVQAVRKPCVRSKSFGPACAWLTHVSCMSCTRGGPPHRWAGRLPAWEKLTRW